jgi:hypothetical protein
MLSVQWVFDEWELWFIENNKNIVVAFSTRRNVLEWCRRVHFCLGKALKPGTKSIISPLWDICRMDGWKCGLEEDQR